MLFRSISGLESFYTGVGSTLYAETNTEYYDGSATSPNYVSSSVARASSLIDISATPNGGPSTSAVLAEACKMATQGGGKPVTNGYYPVYTDIRRGTAGYCAWHSAGTCSGVQITFAFFFDLEGDGGCSVSGGTDPLNKPHSGPLASLGNVTAHELSEMLTDPRLNA